MDFIRAVGIDSDAGFEIGIELVAKARRARLPVAELPTIWLERDQGMSNFKLASWIPRYVRWWLFAFGPRIPVEHGPRSRQPRKTVHEHSSGDRFCRIHRWLRREGAVRPRSPCDRSRQLLEVRTGPAVLRRPRRPINSSRPTARDVDLLAGLLADCDHFIAGAAMIGGISYFHTYAYDLLATNERIIAASCDAAIKLPTGRVGSRRSRICPRRWCSSPPTPGRPTKARSGRSPRRCRRTGSRSWPSSTSPGRPGTSTNCPSPSFDRSTASESARAGPSVTSRSFRATSSWP